MLCPSCHTQNRDNARFCKGCGLPLNGEQPAPMDQASSEQTAGTASDTAHVQQASSVTAPPLPISAATAQSSNGNHTDEDVSQAPTQFLTQEQMHTYHKRKWEQDLAHEQQASSASGHPAAQDIAEQSTILYPSDLPNTPVQEQSTEHEQPQDIAELPTISTAPVSPDSDVHQAAPVPSTTDVEAHSDQNTHEQHPDEPLHQAIDETVTPADQDAPLPGQQEEVMEQTTPPAQQTEQTATNTDQFHVLDTGAIVNERYEISQLINADQHEHTYQVTDRQGYQRCWNCGSEQNSEGDDFCIDCGANLHDAQYIMHEYAPSASANSDSNVLSGVIVNTFMEQNRTYVIEQPQAAQIAFPNGVHLLAASDSDAGDVRRSEPNEDSTLILQFARIHESQSVPAGIFVIADGMGGHDNGQVASRMTISQIAQRMTQELLLSPLTSENAGEQVQQRDEENLVTLVRSAIEDANTILCQTNQHDKTDMGSTLTGFMIVGDHAYIFNVYVKGRQPVSAYHRSFPGRTACRGRSD